MRSGNAGCGWAAAGDGHLDAAQVKLGKLGIEVSAKLRHESQHMRHGMSWRLQFTQSQFSKM